MSTILAGIYGSAVGDALGVPFERKTRDTFLCEDMIVNGGQPYPVGTWSDDTSMLLAEIDSLGRCGYFDDNDTMRNFVSWLFHGKFTPAEQSFGVGRTTSIAVSRFREGMLIEECGGRDVLDNGNGALMRMLPYALLKNPDRRTIADRSGQMTHAHIISRRCCEVYVRVVEELLDGYDPETAVVRAVTPMRARLPDIIADQLLRLGTTARKEIKSTGYVVDTLTASLWCLIHTDNFADAVLAAVNLGSDTDTTGSVTGGLAGILYGLDEEKGVPTAWSHALLRYQWIEKLCEDVAPLMREMPRA